MLSFIVTEGIITAVYNNKNIKFPSSCTSKRTLILVKYFTRLGWCTINRLIWLIDMTVHLNDKNIMEVKILKQDLTCTSLFNSYKSPTSCLRVSDRKSYLTSNWQCCACYCFVAIVIAYGMVWCAAAPPLVSLAPRHTACQRWLSACYCFTVPGIVVIVT